MLLYEPDLLDAWIGRRIVKLEGGTFTDMESGKTLNKQEGKSSKAYLKHHKSRNEEARLADKHSRQVPTLASRQDPRVHCALSRAGKKLLPKARKIRNKLRREGGPASTVQQEPPPKGDRRDSSRPTSGDCDRTLVPAAEAAQSEAVCARTVSRGSDQSSEPRGRI